MNILKLEIEGYKSIGSLELNFDKYKSINIIRGSNGTGKSTSVDSLAYCLYGYDLKGSNKAKVITKEAYRLSSFRGTRIITTFVKNDVEYKVARHIKFKGETFGVTGKDTLLLSIDGELSSGRTVSDVQKELDNILGMSKDVFLNTILLGQKMKRFIESSDKKGIFEEIVNMSFVDDLRQKVGKDLDSMKSENTRIELTMSKVQGELNRLQSLRDSQQMVINKFHEDKEANISRFRQSLSTYKSQLDKIENKLIDYRNVTLTPLVSDEEYINKRYEINKKIDSTNALIQDVSNQIMENNITPFTKIKPVKESEHCSVCKRKHLKAVLKELNDNYEEELKEYNEAKTKYDESRESTEDFIDSLISSREELQLKIKELRVDLDKLKPVDNTEAIKFNNEIQTKIKVLENSKSNVEDNIKRVKSDLKMAKEHEPPEFIDYTNEIQEIQYDIEDLGKKHMELIDEISIAEYWYSNGLTNKGIKGFLLNSALGRLNHYANKYAAILGVIVRFSIDTSMKSQPFNTQVSLGGTLFDYEELSGGEKARVDIISAFCLHDLVSESNYVNLLILDEFFEGLDYSGMEDADTLINIKSSNHKVILITHSDKFQSMEAQTLYYSKLNNLTVVN